MGRSGKSTNLGIFVYENRFKGQCLLEGIRSGLANWPEARADFIPARKRSASVRQLNSYDAILADFNTPEEAVPFEEATVPVVSLSNAYVSERFPRCVPDESALGRLAAAHLLERGYDRFMCLVLENMPAILERANAFKGFIEEKGYSCILVQDPMGKVSMEAFLRELEGIQSPTGLFCWAYLPAYKALKAALSVNRRIPEELGIVGANFDGVLAQISPLTLTRIDLHWERCGSMAVRMAREWLKGSRPDDCLNAAFDVLPGESTKRHPVSDVVLSRCLSLIENNLTDDLSQPVLARHAGASPRLIFNRFREQLGTTPARFVLDKRLERARHLLTQTDLRMHEIAEASGFQDPNYFSTVFKRETGISPRQFRARKASASLL